MATCWNCGAELPEGSGFCPRCGYSQFDRASSPLWGVVEPITGIWNEKFVSALIDQEANRAVRYRRPLSVLVVELDHAQHIVDELEETQVQNLLREMAELLGQAVRDTDTVGFLDPNGPPRFVVLLPETDEPGATLAADKIRRAIASHDFSTSSSWPRITVSCGAATIEMKAASDEEAGLLNRNEYTGNLLREGLEALDSGRSAGTNRTSVSVYKT
jgi:diguanylate cyclase (GGDEF)-like protein